MGDERPRPLTFGKKEEAIFLGREIAQHRDYSEDTAIRIDQEVKKIVMTGYRKASEILETHRESLERIAQALLEREVLDGAEIKLLIEGKPLPEKPTPAPVPEVEAKPAPAPKPEPKPVPVPLRGSGAKPSPA